MDAYCHLSQSFDRVTCSGSSGLVHGEERPGGEARVVRRSPCQSVQTGGSPGLGSAAVLRQSLDGTHAHAAGQQGVL